MRAADMMLLRPRHQAASSSGYKGWKQDGAITRTTEEDNDRRMQPGWTTPGFHAHEAHADLKKRRELAEDLRMTSTLPNAGASPPDLNGWVVEYDASPPAVTNTAALQGITNVTHPPGSAQCIDATAIDPANTTTPIAKQTRKRKKKAAAKAPANAPFFSFGGGAAAASSADAAETSNDIVFTVRQATVLMEPSGQGMPATATSAAGKVEVLPTAARIDYDEWMQLRNIEGRDDALNLVELFKDALRNGPACFAKYLKTVACAKDSVLWYAPTKGGRAMIAVNDARDG